MAYSSPSRPGPPQTREQFETVRYWDESRGRRAQRWYIQLCLFTAAVHDRFVAVEESDRGNKNWSATMAYYSIVHACRGLLFQCFGDFPASHGHLATFLHYGPATRKKREVVFDWLTKLLGNLVKEQRFRGPTEVGSARAILEGFIRDQLSAPQTVDELRRYGPLVRSAKELREKGNYEALLIAHEQRHDVVTPAADSLAGHMSDLAGGFIDLAAGALVAGLERDAGPVEEGDVVQAFARSFIEDRLKPAIHLKLTGGTADAFEAWVGRLHLPLGVGSIDDMWELVMYETFQQKKALMTAYIDKIGAFGERVRAEMDR